MDYSAKIDKLVTFDEACEQIDELEDDVTVSQTNRDKLRQIIKSLPVVNIRLPFRVGHRTLERIGLWLKNNLGKKVLVSVDHEKNRDMKVEVFYKGKWGEY